MDDICNKVQITRTYTGIHVYFGLLCTIHPRDEVHTKSVAELTCTADDYMYVFCSEALLRCQKLKIAILDEQRQFE